MRYKISEMTAELLLSELCEMAGGICPLGDQPPKEFFVGDEQNALFGVGYMPMVPLFGTIDADGIHYELRDVADGVFFDGKMWTVDVVRFVDSGMGKRSVWRSYGYLLGYLLAQREDLKSGGVRVRVISVNRGTSEVKTYCQKVSLERLDGFIRTLLSLTAFRVQALVER